MLGIRRVWVIGTRPRPRLISGPDAGRSDDPSEALHVVARDHGLAMLDIRRPLALEAFEIADQREVRGRGGQPDPTFEPDGPIASPLDGHPAAFRPARERIAL